MIKHETKALFVVIGIWISLVAYITLTRSYFGYNTETDFLGGFLPEAQRLLAGESLALEFHPPFYSIILGLFQSIVNDWFLAGRLLALVSYGVALFTSFYFFRYLISNIAGWSAMFALMASAPFVYYATLATSDMFFYALYSSTLLLAIMAYKNQSLKLWALCGVFVSLVLLTRTNGFTLLVLLFLPWLTDGSFSEKRKTTFVLFSGIFIPMLVWAVIANYSGSPFMPGGTYANLALTYFSPDGSKLTGDARIFLEQKFNNIWEVLAYDPVHMMKSYIRDLYQLVKYVFFSDRLIGYPISLFLIPGLLVLMLRVEKTILFYLFILTLSQLLLVNLKGYEDRLYFFLIPIYGVAVVVCVEIILLLGKRKLPAWLSSANSMVIVALVIMSFPVMLSLKHIKQKSNIEDLALNESVTKSKPMVPKGSNVAAWVPQMPFYLESDYVRFPTVATYQELKNELAAAAVDKPLFVYYGKNELKHRSQFKELLDIGNDYSWLTVVARGSKPAEWVLFKFENQ